MPNTLIHDLQHHAKDKAEVASAIALAFASILNPKGWQVFHDRTGNNSWGIVLRTDEPVLDKTWRFTGYDTGVVTARNDYHWKKATRIVELRTRRDVIRWAKSA